ncbi:hypothetical protein GQ457_10G015990 [Hibiscus cannabinus]
MERKDNMVTTKPSDWEAGIEEPSAFPMCRCGFSAQLRTSWFNDNPGRRFFGCKNYGSVVHHACRFFSWFDPPMTPRARIVLLGLLKRIRANEVQRRKERFFLVDYFGFNSCCVLVNKILRVDNLFKGVCF